MPTSPKNTSDNKRWKRKYMEAEHMCRKYMSLWEKDVTEFSKTVFDCENTIQELRDELRHRKTMHSTQRKVIEALHETLLRHGIPFKNTMASLSNCRADDDEICPLSLMPINKSSIPFCDEIADTSMVINPVKPEHKCAELVCGHRFNSMWLIYYLIERNTFRCPVCRAGQSEFRFQRHELPPTVIKMLDLVNEAKKKQKANGGGSV